MKTLKSIIVAAGLFSLPAAAHDPELPGVEAPRVVVEDLVGFQINKKGNKVKLAWDLNKDDVEDLAVYYNLNVEFPYFYIIGKTYMYKQDRNFNGTYEESETFRFNNK